MDIVTITAAEMHGWAFEEEVAAGAGAFEAGPEGGTGTGSARLAVDGVGRSTLSTAAYDGTLLSAFSDLSYSTWQDPDSPGSDIYAISLQFDIDWDGSDADPEPQSRVVYEPYYQATVTRGGLADLGRPRRALVGGGAPRIRPLPPRRAVFARRTECGLSPGEGRGRADLEGRRAPGPRLRRERQCARGGGSGPAADDVRLRTVGAGGHRRRRQRGERRGRHRRDGGRVGGCGALAGRTPRATSGNSKLRARLARPRAHLWIR